MERLGAHARLDEAVAQLEAFLSPESDPRLRRRREAILKAATDLFIAYGYRKTTIDDVAAAAGVAKGTVYLYYTNKAELLLHAIAYQKLEYVNELAPVFDPTLAPEERLRALIVLSVRLSFEMPLLTRFSRGDPELAQVLAEAEPATLEHLMRVRVDFAADLIDEATGHTWPREALARRAEVLMELVYSFVHGRRLSQQPLPLEVYAEELADLIVGGLARRAS